MMTPTMGEELIVERERERERENGRELCMWCEEGRRGEKSGETLRAVSGVCIRKD